MVPVLQNKMRVERKIRNVLLRVLLGGKHCFVDHDTVTIPYLTVVRNTVANQLGLDCLS